MSIIYSYVYQGRDRKGSIFVWASGNGGAEGDSCACDGYVNSVYTIAITATSENGTKPRYTEECPAILATAYSSGGLFHRRVGVIRQASH